MDFKLQLAVPKDAKGIAALHVAASNDLTRRYGRGHWSSKTSEQGVLGAMKRLKVFVACDADEIIATLRLDTKKPWSIDLAHFRPVQRPLYLVNMAVTPKRQRQGIGRRCLQEAIRLAREWPADALRLDAYDAEAGAVGFYIRCGFAEVGRGSYRETPLVYFEAALNQ